MLEPYWETLALGRFGSNLVALGSDCHDLEPIFLRMVLWSGQFISVLVCPYVHLPFGKVIMSVFLFTAYYNMVNYKISPDRLNFEDTPGLSQ